MNPEHNGYEYLRDCLDRAIEAISELHMAYIANDTDIADGFNGAFFQGGYFHINTVDVDDLDNVGQYQVSLKDMLEFLQDIVQDSDVIPRHCQSNA